MKLQSGEVEDFIKFCKKVGKIEEAAHWLAKVN